MRIILFSVLLTISTSIFCQHNEESKRQVDSLQMEQLKSRVTFPLISGPLFSGVIPYKDPDDKPDPDMPYKLLFELVYNNPDSLSKEINKGLVEIARIINLHVAAGIPVKNLDVVILVHGMSLNSFKTEEYYNKAYSTDNPNLAFIDQIKNKVNTKIVACSQAMAFFNFPREQMISDVKITLAAKVALSTYQEKGYVLYLIEEVD